MKSKWVLATFLAVCVAASAALGFVWSSSIRKERESSTMVDPPGVFATEPVTDCRAVELPTPGAEINTVLDYYSKKLAISFYDPRLGEDRHIYVSYEDPACRENPDLRTIIDGALGVHKQTVAETCRSMAEIVRRGNTLVAPPGRPAQRINLEAAKKYLERWCK